MGNLETFDSDDLLREQMQDPAFKAAYSECEEGFTIAEEVIELRKNAKLTQKELAELVGTSQPAIARLESGEYKNLTLSFLRRVGEALGATPEVHFRKKKTA